MKIKRSMKTTKSFEGPILSFRPSATLALHQTPLSHKICFNRSIANGAHEALMVLNTSISISAMVFSLPMELTYTALKDGGRQGSLKGQDARLGFPAYISKSLDLP